ncbi:MAG: acetyl-CoA carboxylase carboxyltransferase subunit [Alphaproteobacteria bacterium RIFCSPHIGHO2_12_FULL_63_12]|nr:MAG: acetyl-CoA carboxylase carboxyltransferase subunit [Alphaproteobacteria bacterium RIFCSPHIGHO2_12_FULL_63_12]
MPVFQSEIDTRSESFASNRAAHLKLIEEFRGFERKIVETSARARAKFEKRGQLLPRDRLALVLDRGAPFLELSTLCGLNMHDDDGGQNVSGGGGIAGIGFVSGVRCLVSASDSGIKGGAATPMGVQKALRAQEIALKQKLPFVQLIESAGANLFRQAEMFVPGGQTFANLARLSAAGCPVISVVHGSSTAGGAYQTGLSDYVIVVRGRSKVFLAGPPLLKAATGEIATDEQLGGAEMHYHVSGVADYMAENDADALRIAREIAAKLQWNKDAPARARSFREPLYDPEEILGVTPADYRTPYDVRENIARIVDGSDLLGFKDGYGAATVCVHAEIAGHAVGIISNNGPIDADGATKAAQFIQLQCQAGTPVVFLQNTTGYLVGTDAEQRGIVKHGSKMIQAVTNMTVPKITLHIGASFGAGNYGMCGRAFDPSFIFAWPNNRVAVMGGEQAAKTMRIVGEEGAKARGEEPNAAYFDAMAKTIIDKYDAESRALFATARLWDDGLIDPRDSRKLLAFCLDTVSEARERRLRPNVFGVARM